MSIDDITSQIEKLHADIRAVMPIAQKQVQDVIDHKLTDPKYIEWILDDLLGFVSHGYGVEEFRKLNSYYATFAAENAEAYQRFLDEALE